MPTKGKPGRLPASWNPDCLTYREREEYDHLIGYRLTPDAVAARLGWSIEKLCRRSQRHNEERASVA